MDLRAREPKFIPGLKTLGVALFGAFLLIGVLVIFPPVLPESGYPIGVIFRRGVVYILVVGIPMISLAKIWMEWWRKGVEYDPSSGALWFHWPTYWGLGDPFVQSVESQDRRIETRPVPPIIRRFVKKLHVDDRYSDQDFNLWYMSPEDAEWLQSLDTAVPNKSPVVQAKDSAESRPPAQAGDIWFRKMILLLARALLIVTPSVANVIFLIEQLSQEDDNNDTRNILERKILNWAINPKSMRRDLEIKGES